MLDEIIMKDNRKIIDTTKITIRVVDRGNGWENVALEILIGFDITISMNSIKVVRNNDSIFECLLIYILCTNQKI